MTRHVLRFCHKTGKAVPLEEWYANGNRDETIRKKSNVAVWGSGKGNGTLESVSLPLNWPYAPRHGKDGVPQFEGLREIRESVARAKHAGEPVEYHKGHVHIR